MTSKTRVEKSTVSATEAATALTKDEMARLVIEQALHEGNFTSISYGGPTQSHFGNVAEQYFELTALNTPISISQMLVRIMNVIERIEIRLEDNEEDSSVLDQLDDDWSLTADQMIFMLQNHNLIADAFEDDDIPVLHALAETNEFKKAFGDMSFDEAYDRYECAIEE